MKEIILILLEIAYKTTLFAVVIGMTFNNGLPIVRILIAGTAAFLYIENRTIVEFIIRSFKSLKRSFKKPSLLR